MDAGVGAGDANPVSEFAHRRAGVAGPAAPGKDQNLNPFGGLGRSGGFGFPVPLGNGFRRTVEIKKAKALAGL
jgi:hypothetical protein